MCISLYVLYIVGDITRICLLKRVDVFFNSMYLFVAETFSLAEMKKKQTFARDPITL